MYPIILLVLFTSTNVLLIPAKSVVSDESTEKMDGKLFYLTCNYFVYLLLNLLIYLVSTII